jgi:RimK family alpha-L-glutamate ligase
MPSIFEKYLDKKPAVSGLKIPLFGKIIAEQEERAKGTDVNVLILSVKEWEAGEKDDSPKWTVNRIKNWCQSKNISCYVAYMGDSFITRKDDVLKIQNTGDDTGFVLDPAKTIVMIRGGAQITKSHMMADLIAQLERYNIFCVNSRETIEACGDKYRTYLKLTDAGLPCPRSALVHGEEMIAPAMARIGGKFPVVVKLLSGSKGVGVFIIDSEKSLKSVLQVMWKVDENAELLMQEFIAAEFDVRVHVLGDRVVAAMKRYVIKDDFRSNYSLGSEIESIDLEKDQKEICIKAAKAVGALWAGVDMIIAKEDKKPYFLEINSSPGTYGIEKAMKKDVVSEVMNYLADKKNWIKVPQMCGFQEIVDIDEIGSIVAKFDTGNGATCAVHAEDIKIDKEKKTVSWHTNGTKFDNHPYHRRIKLIKGAIGGTEVKKVTVLLNVNFNGTLYKNVEFALDDRTGKTTPVLISRKYMRDANIIVNPSKAFLVTINPFNNDDQKEKLKVQSKTDSNFDRSDEITDDNVEE